MADRTATAVAEPDDEGQPDEANGVEARLSKLEKALLDTTKVLDEERKSSQGKDKKITALAEERKKLMEAAGSKDKLLELREKELEERTAEEEAKFATRNAELEKLRIELERRKVLDKIENFPPFLADRVHGNTPDEIEADARGLMKSWIKDRDKVDNARKVGPKPQSGSGKQLAHTADDVAHMSAQEKTKWAQTATKEEFDIIFDALHSGEN